MLNAILLGINLEDNRQLGPIVVAIAVIVVVGVIIVANVLKMRDRKKEKLDAEIDAERQAERVIQGVAGRSKKGTATKKMNHGFLLSVIKR